MGPDIEAKASQPLQNRNTQGADTGERRFSERSPDEVRQRVKESVRRGIASVAGALEGLNEEVEQDRLPEKTERAVHNVGETTRKMLSATRDETRQTRETMKGAVHEMGRSTREIAGAAKDETKATQRTIRGDGQTARRTGMP